MEPRKMPSLKNISKIVINQIAVWQAETACNCTEAGRPSRFWRKVAGGAGFKFGQKSGIKTYPQMLSHIIQRLSKIRTVRKYSDGTMELYEQIPDYRWWISGETLNICQKDEERDLTGYFKACHTRGMAELDSTIEALLYRDKHPSQVPADIAVNDTMRDRYRLLVKIYGLTPSRKWVD